MSLREHLHRYWFRFAAPDGDVPHGAQLGCGVTAVDRADAERLLKAHTFDGELPPVVSVVEDVDVQDLDARHVLPNMGDPSRRGRMVAAGLAAQRVPQPNGLPGQCGKSVGTREDGALSFGCAGAAPAVLLSART